MLGKIGVGPQYPVRIMGIINASAESFYKESVREGADEIKKEAAAMAEAGADYIDIGGMSTAPYLDAMVPEAVEFGRVQTAILAVSDACELPISVDTVRSGVARMALESGATILNDVSGFTHDPKMPDVISRYSPDIVLCAHSEQRRAGDEQDTAMLLAGMLGAAKKYGADVSRTVVDPAIGFFRNADNPLCTRIDRDWALRDACMIRHLRSIAGGMPALVSASNKSFIGKMLDGRPPEGRLYGSLAAEAMAVAGGADIIRTHNVSQSRDAVRVASAIAGRHA